MNKTALFLIAITLCCVGCGGGNTLKKSGDINLTLPPGYTQSVKPLGTDSWSIELVPDAVNAAKAAPNIIVTYFPVGGESLDSLLVVFGEQAKATFPNYANEEIKEISVGGSAGKVVTATSGKGSMAHRSLLITQPGGAMLSVSAQSSSGWMQSNAGVIDGVAEGISWK